MLLTSAKTVLIMLLCWQGCIDHISVHLHDTIILVQVMVKLLEVGNNPGLRSHTYHQWQSSWVMSL